MSQLYWSLCFLPTFPFFDLVAVALRRRMERIRGSFSQRASSNALFSLPTFLAILSIYAVNIIPNWSFGWKANSGFSATLRWPAPTSWVIVRLPASANLSSLADVVNFKLSRPIQPYGEPLVTSPSLYKRDCCANKM
jgi:hypothetical protein